MDFRTHSGRRAFGYVAGNKNDIFYWIYSLDFMGFSIIKLLKMWLAARRISERQLSTCTRLCSSGTFSGRPVVGSPPSTIQPTKNLDNFFEHIASVDKVRMSDSTATCFSSEFSKTTKLIVEDARIEISRDISKNSNINIVKRTKPRFWNLYHLKKRGHWKTFIFLNINFREIEKKYWKRKWIVDWNDSIEKSRKMCLLNFYLGQFASFRTKPLPRWFLFLLVGWLRSRW